MCPLVIPCSKEEMERETCSGCVWTGSQQVSSKIIADELQTKTKRFHIQQLQGTLYSTLYIWSENILTPIFSGFVCKTMEHYYFLISL